MVRALWQAVITCCITHLFLGFLAGPVITVPIIRCRTANQWQGLASICGMTWVFVYPSPNIFCTLLFSIIIWQYVVLYDAKHWELDISFCSCSPPPPLVRPSYAWIIYLSPATVINTEENYNLYIFFCAATTTKCFVLTCSFGCSDSFAIKSCTRTHHLILLPINSKCEWHHGHTSNWWLCCKWTFIINFHTILNTYTYCVLTLAYEA